LYRTSGDSFILWQNPRNSSDRYCRPIGIQFKKERAELAEEETSVVEERIKKLEKNGHKFGGKNSVVFVSHNMMLTMLDGIICNVIPSTSAAQVCYICDASLKQTYRMDGIVKRDVEITIRAVYTSRVDKCECLLHISYCLEIKK